jgi:glycerol-3-phosphate dehydrogenase (NAD(P)+)
MSVDGGRHIAVVGAGSWGTALTQALTLGGKEVRLWARDATLSARIARDHVNPAYLPGVPLSRSICVTDNLATALQGAAVAILAVPTHGMAATAELCREHLDPECAVVSAAKGLEASTSATMTQLLKRVLGDDSGARLAALSGPNIAMEIARGQLAATVVGCADPGVRAGLRDALWTPQLRVYGNGDVLGVEIGGALKNVVAIAAGICDGLNAGDNGKAAVMTRGIAEMTRVGVAAGASPLTFAGLAGLGDCAVTCMSPLSRNRRLGEAVGRGATLEQAEAGMFQVAEGVNAARATRDLGRRLAVETPIADAVCAVLFDGVSVVEAISDLMHRDTRDELE